MTFDLRPPLRTLGSLAAAAFVAIGCIDCGGGEAVRLGAVVPLTGEAQTFGASIKKGLELAHEQVLAQGENGKGMEILLPIVDSKSDPELAATQLGELYDDGALAVIGAVTSAEAKTMIPVADKYDRVLLSPSASSPELTGASENFYRIYPSDFRAASKMANFVTQQIGVEQVVVIAEEQVYARGIQEVFKQEFERYGGKVLEVIEYPANTSDFGGIVERVMTLRPSAVYVAAYDVATGMLIETLRNAGFKGRILTTSAFATPVAIARIGDAAAGVILTQSVFELDSEHAHVRTFVEAYREKFGEDPDIYAAHGYDALMVMVEAIRGRPLLPSEVPKGLREEFPGVTGSIRFDDKGDVQKYPRVYVIGDDLALYDYNERVQEERERILDQRREIEERLRRLREQAARDVGEE